MIQQTVHELINRKKLMALVLVRHLNQCVHLIW